MLQGRKLITLVMFFMCSLFFMSKSTLTYAAVELSDPPTNEKTATPSKVGPSEKTVVNKKLNLAENNPVAALLCKAIRAFTGTISKIIAVILLVGLGVTILQSTSMNPLNPVTIVSFIIGIGVFFSAEYVVGKVMGDAGYGGDKNRACDCKYGISNCDV